MPKSNAARCRLANDIAFSFSIKPVRHEFEFERSKLIDTERERVDGKPTRARADILGGIDPSEGTALSILF